MDGYHNFLLLFIDKVVDEGFIFPMAHPALFSKSLMPNLDVNIPTGVVKIFLVSDSSMHYFLYLEENYISMGEVSNFPFNLGGMNNNMCCTKFECAKPYDLPIFFCSLLSSWKL